MMQKNFPSVEDFRAYLVTQLGQVEVIRQSLYDTMLYPLAGIAALSFFQTPIGQGLSASPGNAGLAKALTDTNMQLAGQLPSPQGFWVESIELVVEPGSSAAANTFAIQPPSQFAAANAVTVQAGEHDVQRIYNTGALTLTIGTKPYLQEAPLVRFPPKARHELDATVASTSATVGVSLKSKARAGGRPYYINPGCAIQTSQNFGVTLTWPVIVALPTNNAAIRCILDGWLFRAVQ